MRVQSGPNQPQGGFDPFFQQQPQGQWPQQPGMPPQPAPPNGQWMPQGQPVLPCRTPVDLLVR